MTDQDQASRHDDLHAENDRLRQRIAELEQTLWRHLRPSDLHVENERLRLTLAELEEMLLPHLERNDMPGEKERLGRRVADLEETLLRYLRHNVGISELGDEAFRELSKMGERSVPFWIRALSFPPPIRARLMAAEELGRMRARDALPALLQSLKVWDIILIEKAIWSLGEIGDASAVPHLIPFLGNRPPADMLAAEALVKLNEGELVDAFRHALQKDESALEALRERFRLQIIEALLRALQFQSLHPAAWALVGIGALEALPILRQKRFWMTEAMKPACDEAIVRLEALAELPRAADSTEIESETLPRSPEIGEPTRETLPRSIPS